MNFQLRLRILSDFDVKITKIIMNNVYLYFSQ